MSELTFLLEILNKFNDNYTILLTKNVLYCVVIWYSHANNKKKKIRFK